jgi:hypothetical protein
MYTTAPIMIAAANSRNRKQYFAFAILRSSADVTIPSFDPVVVVPALDEAGLEAELLSPTDDDRLDELSRELDSSWSVLKVVILFILSLFIGMMEVTCFSKARIMNNW